jgi:enoyl-CoA hydratase/carnithine racemase
MTVHYEFRDDVAIVTIDRPAVANAVDGETALRLVDAFERFENDDQAAARSSRAQVRTSQPVVICGRCSTDRASR